LFYPGLNNAGQVPYPYFLWLAAAQTRDGDDLVLFGFVGQGRTELDLQQFGVFLHHITSLTDVFGDDITAVRNYGSMPDNSVVKDGNICCPATDIYQGHTGLQFLAA